VSGVLVQVKNTPLANERSSLIDMCNLRLWCYKNVRSEWHSYFIGTSEENTLRGIGFVVFEFENPREEMKFKLWTGA